MQRFPKLAKFLLQNLEEILEGQDLSLIWRRDGLGSLSTVPEERVAAYRKMASLKTGALFRLLGQLVMEDQSMDGTMTTLAYGSLDLLHITPSLAEAEADLEIGGALSCRTIARMSTHPNMPRPRGHLQKTCVIESSHIQSFSRWKPPKGIGSPVHWRPAHRAISARHLP